MHTLFGCNTISNTVLPKLWMDKLHTNTTQILASLPDDLDLQKLAEITDKINDNKPTNAVFAAIQSPSVTVVSDSHELLKSLADLTLQLRSLQNSIRQQNFSQSNQASR